jgi:iron complex outermembrane receptor protein
LPIGVGLRKDRGADSSFIQGETQVTNKSSEPIVFRKTLLAQSISAAILTSVAGTGAAQDIEEITVTATKREESIQDVPLAITAFTGDFVKDVNLDDVKDLVTFTPGVSGNSTDAFIDGISVRGVRTQDFGVGGDPSAAFFKNNLYEGRNGAVVTSLYDLERAEILRGPQGFLFGRNAIGGAFSVHTKRPTLDGASDGVVEVDVGERGRFTFEGATNIAASENFALRVAGYHSSEDGYVRNTFDGQDYLAHDKSAVRLTGVYAKDALEITGTVEYEDMDRDGSTYRTDTRAPRLAQYETALGPVDMPADPRSINSDLFGGSADDAQIMTLGLHVDYDFESMSLSWSTGYKDHDYLYSEDYDGTPRTAGLYRQQQSGDYLQSELRLTSNSDGPLSWYAGVSMYEENLDYHVRSSVEEEVICNYYSYYYSAYYYPGSGVAMSCSEYFDYLYYYEYPVNVPFVSSSDGKLNEDTFVTGKYTGWAAYADLSYQINDMWDVSFGVRHTYDKKQFTRATPKPESMLLSYFLPGFMNEPITNTNDWSDTTMRAVVRFMPSDTQTLFASYTEGYKSGGFGTFAIVDAATGDPVFQWFGDGDQDPLTEADGIAIAQFKPEDVTNYEVGWKGVVADGRVAIDLTGFVYEYEDLQVNYYDGGAKVDNVGSVDGMGIEGSIQWAMNEHWDLILAAGWLDTEAFQLEKVCDGAPDADGLPDGDPLGCEGNKIYWSPDFMGSMVLKADYPVANGRIVGNIEGFWESERGGSWSDLPWQTLDSFTEWTVRVGYESNNNWSVTGYVENLTDELNYAGLQYNTGITPEWLVGPNRPRTAGVRFGYYFD